MERTPRSELERFLLERGRTIRDLATEAGIREATVWGVVAGQHVPGVRIATELAAATARMAGDDGGAVTPAQILGVADWTPEAAE